MEEELLSALNRIDQLARGPKIIRALHTPLPYLWGQLFSKLWYPLTKKGKLATVHTFWDQAMQILLPAGMDIYLLGAKTHDSELRLARFLIRQLGAGHYFVDVGAHFGFFSLLASQLVGPGGKVLAVEASPQIFSILEKNVGQIPWIEPYHAAVSEHSGELSFFEFPLLYSEYNSLAPEQYQAEGWYRKNPPRERKVPATSLDELFGKETRNPDLIKIDVEGAEWNVMKGMEQLLQRSQPLLVMEYLWEGRQNQAHKNAVALAQTFGYRPFLIGKKGELRKVPELDKELMNLGLDSDNIVLMPPSA